MKSENFKSLTAKRIFGGIKALNNINYARGMVALSAIIAINTTMTNLLLLLLLSKRQEQ